jgi:hypothetical protein
MKPSQEYMDMIAKRLEAMNPAITGNVTTGGVHEPYAMPSMMDQMGMSAMEYLKNKKPQDMQEDPLFTNHN